MFLSFLHRSSRAQRALGDHHYYRKALPLAIQHYRLSVACNHLQLPVWQNLAFAALQVKFYCFLFVLLFYFSLYYFFYRLQLAVYKNLAFAALQVHF